VTRKVVGVFVRFRAASPLKERELNELRTNLVSTISHEFRTPMTTIELVQN
jgi:signal transduction histidine kinase